MLLLLLLLSSGALAAQESRAVESVVPSLKYGRTCWSTVHLRNLADRPVTATVEPHKETGALVELAGTPGTRFQLDPGASISFRLDLAEETDGAWVEVRETVPSPDLSPALAISATAECAAGDQLRSAGRDVAYPLRDPWFSGDVSDLKDSRVSLVNTSERAARVRLCYSGGGLFANPNQGRADLRPICDAELDVQIPPFAARQFPVERDGNSGFAIRTSGEAIVLQMLRPSDPATRMYAVDSTIQFLSDPSSP